MAGGVGTAARRGATDTAERVSRATATDHRGAMTNPQAALIAAALTLPRGATLAELVDQAEELEDVLDAADRMAEHLPATAQQAT